MNPDLSGIDDYIKANRGRYTDEAIRTSLASAGHAPSSINEAFARLGVEAPAAQAPKPATGLVTFAWTLLVIGLLIGLAGFGMGGYFIAGASVPIFLIVFGGIGLALILVLRWAIPRFGISGGGAVLIGLGLLPAFVLLLYGSCAASFITRV